MSSGACEITRTNGTFVRGRGSKVDGSLVAMEGTSGGAGEGAS